MDLKRNDNLLPDKHFLRYQNSNSTQGRNVVVVKNFTKTEIALCHYQVAVTYSVFFCLFFLFLSIFSCLVTYFPLFCVLYNIMTSIVIAVDVQMKKGLHT